MKDLFEFSTSVDMHEQDFWDIVNACQSDDPKIQIQNVSIVEEFLKKSDSPVLWTEDWKGNILYDELMDSLACLSRDSYRRMK